MEFSILFLEDLIIYGSGVFTLFLHFPPVIPYICDEIVNTYQSSLENTERGTLVKILFLYRRQVREFYL